MSEEKERGADIKMYMRALWRRKLLLIVPVLVAGVAGYVLAKTMTPIYESKSTLLVRTPSRLSEPLARLIGRSQMEEQLSRIQEKTKSQTFLTELVKALEMDKEPQIVVWAKTMHAENPSISVEEFAERKAVQVLQSRISVSRKSTNAFQIVVRSKDPEKAYLLAQHITNAFVTASNREQLEQIRAVHDFSVEQLVIYKQKLDDSERRLKEFRERRLPGGVIQNPVTDDNVGRVEMLTSQAMIDRDEAKARRIDKDSLLRSMSEANYLAVMNIPSEEIDSLSRQLVSLERQAAPGLALHSQESPEVSSLYVSIAEKKDELRRLARRLAGQALPQATRRFLDAYAELVVARAEVDMTEARHTTFSRFLILYRQGRASAPEDELELARLEEEVESNRALYEAFLQQSAVGQITEALEGARAGGHIEIVELPSRPMAPVAPDKVVVLALSLMGGLVVGLGGVILAEHTDTSFKDVADVQSSLGFKALATVPDADIFHSIASREKSNRRQGIKPIAGNPLIIKSMMQETPLSFEFRRLVARLAKVGKGQIPRSILVTSAHRGEGKTTTAACLAIALARHRKGSVALIDCDLRKPRVHRLMEVDPNGGISDALDRCSLEDSDVKACALPNLFVVPCGSKLAIGARLIETLPGSRVMAQLLERFEHIVLDTAPNVAVPDAVFLGPHVDFVVIVVKAGATPREVVLRGVELQQEDRANVLGVVVNNVEGVLPYYYDYKYYGYSDDKRRGRRPTRRS